MGGSGGVSFRTALRLLVSPEAATFGDSYGRGIIAVAVGIDRVELIPLREATPTHQGLARCRQFRPRHPINPDAEAVISGVVCCRIVGSEVSAGSTKQLRRTTSRN